MNRNKEPENNFIDSGSSNIRIENISKSFFGIEVLNNINLDFNSGEIHGLVGQNGAGKSTLGKIIGGHYTLSSGNIYLNNKKITKWSSKLALDNGIAMIHQELALVPGMTVYENIFLGIEENTFGVLNKKNYGYAKAANQAIKQCDTDYILMFQADGLISNKDIFILLESHKKYKNCFLLKLVFQIVIYVRPRDKRVNR